MGPGIRGFPEIAWLHGLRLDQVVTSFRVAVAPKGHGSTQKTTQKTDAENGTGAINTPWLLGLLARWFHLPNTPV